MRNTYTQHQHISILLLGCSGTYECLRTGTGVRWNPEVPGSCGNKGRTCLEQRNQLQGKASSCLAFISTRWGVESRNKLKAPSMAELETQFPDEVGMAVTYYHTQGGEHAVRVRLPSGWTLILGSDLLQVTRGREEGGRKEEGMRREKEGKWAKLRTETSGYQHRMFSLGAQSTMTLTNTGYYMES